MPRASIVANINMDMFLPLFPMKSVMVLGLDESDLGDRVRDVAKRLGLGVNPDPQPARNRFTRSDQYSFIRQGVPALALKVGFDPGSPEAEIDARWTRERYHQPSDDLQQPVDLGAAMTFTRLVGALAADVANHAGPAAMETRQLLPAVRRRRMTLHRRSSRLPALLIAVAWLTPGLTQAPQAPPAGGTPAASEQTVPPSCN